MGDEKSMTWVTSGKSRVREIRTPGSVRAKPNGIATRPRPTITSAHGWAAKAQAALTRIAAFFAELRTTAEQLTAEQRWYRILS